MLQIHNLCDGASYQSADKDNQLIRITCLKVPPTCQLRPTLLGWTIRLLLQVIWANFMLQVVSKINARSTAQSPKTWTTENWNCKTVAKVWKDEKITQAEQIWFILIISSSRSTCLFQCQPQPFLLASCPGRASRFVARAEELGHWIEFTRHSWEGRQRSWALDRVYKAQLRR